MDVSTPALHVRRGCRAVAVRLGQRPVLSASVAALLVAAYFTFLGNVTFWGAIAASEGTSGPALRAVILLLALVTNWMLATLINIRGVFKPIVAVLLVTSVVVDHFMNAYGVLIDSAMVQNTVDTDTREVIDLITTSLVLHVLVFAALPLAILLRVEIRYRKPLVQLASQLGALLAGVAIIGALGAGSYKDLAVFARNHRQLRHLITPFNYLQAVRGYVSQEFGGPRTLVALGRDARRTPAARERDRPKLIVLVVGETARAASFSLNGYERETNPELAQESVISYRLFHACATATATALPCMFSGLQRTEYSDKVAKHRENLLDVLQHAGISILWRENNTGCKGVCDRVPTEVLNDNSERLDEVLLGGLDDRLANVDTDTLIVLHQEGSHGPAYYRRYPEAFRRFVPTCDTNDLLDCEREAVVNTYDNTILYTDHMLAETIRLLRRHVDRLDIGLIYVSDHGESLGENNVYLHGLPYWMAPDEQTRVPFILWPSPGLVHDVALDLACISDRRDEPFSHDHLFHSILGLMEVETEVYDPTLDLLGPCRRGAAVAQAP